MPPYFLFAPLERHIDSGFGAVAGDFMRSAEALENPTTIVARGNMPVAFLYRHAIELFLKGSILTVHRTIQIPYGDSASDADPYVLIGSRWRPMYQVHDISNLFEHLKRTLIVNAALVRARASTRWDEVPEELERRVAAVHELDATSTFFRYPVTKQGGDSIKSPFKSVDDLASIAAGPAATTLLMLDANERVVEAFTSQGAPLESATTLLHDAAEDLSAMHFGLRVELAGGW